MLSIKKLSKRCNTLLFANIIHIDKLWSVYHLVTYLVASNIFYIHYYTTYAFKKKKSTDKNMYYCTIAMLFGSHLVCVHIVAYLVGCYLLHDSYIYTPHRKFTYAPYFAIHPKKSHKPKFQCKEDKTKYILFCIL